MAHFITYQAVKLHSLKIKAPADKGPKTVRMTYLTPPPQHSFKGTGSLDFQSLFFDLHLFDNWLPRVGYFSAKMPPKNDIVIGCTPKIIPEKLNGEEEEKLRKSRDPVSLKGQSHEIFCTRFFS